MKIGEYSAKCLFCKCPISLGNMGFSAVSSHFNTQKHRNVADVRKNRVSGQLVLANPRDDTEDADDPHPIVDGNGESHAIDDGHANAAPPAASNSNRNNGLLRYFISGSQQVGEVQSQVATENNNNSTKFTSLTDKVAKAEILIFLHNISKNASFQGLDSLQPVLKLGFSDSQIADKMIINRKKASYVLTEALGPHLLNETLKDIRAADAYVIGLDSATTKHLGLSKGVDVKIRYYSERYHQVVDVFVGTKNLGHEKSEHLRKAVVEIMEESELSAEKVFVISRDNPNVMKSFQKLIDQTFKEAGNPQLMEAPCSLHPTHTAFQQAVKKLGFDVDKFLVDVHSFFKLSTARREDMTELRKELEMEDVLEFFPRHVTTRWSSMKPVCERIVKHWSDLTEYFVIYLRNSTESNHIEAVKSDKYKRIYNVLKPSVNVQNLTRLKFVIHLAGKTEGYLKSFQSLQPMSYKLYIDICLMIAQLMTSVVREEKIPKDCDGAQFLKVDLEDITEKHTNNDLKRTKHCDFGPVVKAALLEISEDERYTLKVEFKGAMQAMIKYMVSRMPLKNKFLKDLAFSNPKMIDSSQFVPGMIRIAQCTKRFSNQELDCLDTQLKMVKLTMNLPEFTEADTFDGFWINKLIKLVKERNDVDCAELIKLIKLISIYPNSNAFLERGFSDTKRIADVRARVSEKVMKYSKVVLDVCRQVGGPDKVPITAELVGAHHHARQNYQKRLLQEKKDKEAAIIEENRIAEVRERKRKHDEEMKSWDTKVQDINESIDVLKSTLTNHEEQQRKAFDDAVKFKNKTNRDTAIKTAQLAAQNISELRVELNMKQDKLTKLMLKKPKYS